MSPRADTQEERRASPLRVAAAEATPGTRTGLASKRRERARWAGLLRGLTSPPVSLPRQDEELLGHVQSAILQVQGDCEKLNITTSNLIEDHRQKQKDIDVRGRRGGGVAAEAGVGGVGVVQRRAPHSLLSRLPRSCSRVYRSLRRRRPTGSTWRWRSTW